MWAEKYWKINFYTIRGNLDKIINFIGVEF